MIPTRFPATGSDLVTIMLRGLCMHLELACRLSFAGRLDVARLRRAVRISLDVEPVLGCALKTGFFAGSWERLDDIEERTFFRMVETSDSDLAWRQFLRGNIADAGPQVTVELVRTQVHDEILIRMSHFVADGQATKSYAYLLADIYTHLSTDPDYSPQPILAPRPSAVDASVDPSVVLRETAATKFRGQTWIIPFKALTGEGRTVRERKLDPERFGIIREYGKTRGASIHEILVAALLRATSHVFPAPSDTPMALDFSVDLRRFVSADATDRITNLSVTLHMALPCSQDDEFDHTLKSVCEQTAEMRDASWGLKWMAGTERLARRAFKPLERLFAYVGTKEARRGAVLPGLSNLGVLDEGRLAFAGVAPTAAVMAGPAIWGAGQLVTVSTYRDAMTISIGFCEVDQDPAVVEAVLQAMVDELERCCAADSGLRAIV